MKTAVRKSATPRHWSVPPGNERRLATEHPRRRILRLAAGAAALPALSRIAWAQAYPTRPVTIVIPFPAGGGADAIGRMLAVAYAGVTRSACGDRKRNWRGGGSIGVGRVARAASDGYTLILGTWGTFVANGVAYAVPYNLLTDFEPIALVTAQPIVIVAKEATPAIDLKGLIAWLKANADGDQRRGEPSARRCYLPSKQNRHSVRLRTLSRRRACIAGFSGWTDRLDVCGGGRCY